ncbi:hypothetical protein C8Q80DRAFT_767529 [Daedaleopsis nitida]|nr:hypothetical protein C8Q80DRAFT_767529 [Daedaleopsis nitida]
MQEMQKRTFDELMRPPQWLIDHPALRDREIDFNKPFGILKLGKAFSTGHFRAPNHGVKMIKPASQEADIYDKLLRYDPRSPNHTLPCEVIRSDTETPFIIMPLLRDLTLACLSQRWDLPTLVHHFLQILEGVEFLHRAQIAHMDIAVSNFILTYIKGLDDTHKGVELNKIYIIDYGESLQLELGPGQQPAVDLPPSQIPKPDGITRLDPYSWDMYCVGLVFQSLAEDTFKCNGQSTPKRLKRYIEWVIGNQNETGCASKVCRCRPTARRAREALSVLQYIVQT